MFHHLIATPRSNVRWMVGAFVRLESTTWRAAIEWSNAMSMGFQLFDASAMVFA